MIKEKFFRIILSNENTFKPKRKGGNNMDAYLLIIALLSIVIVIVGVSLFKWHAFISLTVASLFLAVFSGLSFEDQLGFSCLIDENQLYVLKSIYFHI